MTDELRVLEQRMAAKLRGQKAATTLESLREWFELQQKMYLQALVTKTRQEDMPAASEVWKLVALDDVFNDLANAISEGRGAERELDPDRPKVKRV